MNSLLFNSRDNNDNNFESSFFSIKELNNISNKPSPVDIINLIKYILKKIFPKIGTTLWYDLYHDLYLVFSQIFKLKINTFLLVSTVWLLEKIHNVKNDLINSYSLVYYFMICFTLVDKYINDEHYALLPLIRFINLSTDLVIDEELNVLKLIDYNVTLNYKEIQNIIR
jgi:hypothetical protein